MKSRFLIFLILLISQQAAAGNWAEPRKGGPIVTYLILFMGIATVFQWTAELFSRQSGIPANYGNLDYMPQFYPDNYMFGKKKRDTEGLSYLANMESNDLVVATTEKPLIKSEDVKQQGNRAPMNLFSKYSQMDTNSLLLLCKFLSGQIDGKRNCLLQNHDLYRYPLFNRLPNAVQIEYTKTFSVLPLNLGIK